MKNLYQLLLGVLIIATNSSSLLAQDEYRLKTINQVIGCRLQDENRLKAEGYRLKETESQTKDHRETELLSGDQIEQGGKTTTNYNNQATGCRLQGTGLETTELLSENQMGQGAKFTTNHEVRTANCNNSGVDLNSYLMMNPETTQELEDIIKLSRSSLVSSETSSERGVLNAVQTPFIEGEESKSAVVPSQGDVIKNSTFKFEEKFVKISAQIEEITQALQEGGSRRTSYLLDRIVTKLKQSRDSWNKFGELFSQGEQERAFLWKKVAEESETSVNKIKQLFVSRPLENKEQLEKEIWNFYCLSDISTWELKSKEAGIKAELLQGEEKELWKNLASQYQQAADYEKQGLEMEVLEKEDERDSCIWIGRYFYSSAKRKLQAIEAKKAGKDILAIGYQDAAGILEEAIEEEKKALIAYTLGKESEGFGYSWLAGSIQNQASYQVEMIEAQEAGKTILVESYREVLETLQKVTDQYRLSVGKCVTDKKNESKILEWMGDFFQQKANYQIKAIDAQEAGKKVLASGYQKLVEICDWAANQYQLPVKKGVASQVRENSSWVWMESSLQQKVDYQLKALKAEREGKKKLAKGYQEAAELCQRAVDQFELSAEKLVLGRKDESNSRKCHGRSLLLKADHQVDVIEVIDAKGVGVITSGENDRQEKKEYESVRWELEGISLQKKANYQVKAIEAYRVGKIKIAKDYQEAAKTSQQSADLLKRSAISRYSLEKEEGESLQAKTDYQVRMIEAEEAGKVLFANSYQEIAETFQEVIDQIKLLFSLMHADTGREGQNYERYYQLKHEEESCRWLLKSLRIKADHQIKAIEAGEVGEIESAKGYREAVQILQKAEDQYILVVKEKIFKKEKDAGWRESELESLQKEAIYKTKAIEYQEARNTVFAKSYQEAAEISEYAANSFKQAVVAFALKQEKAAFDWSNIGRFLEIKLQHKVKAIENKREIKFLKKGMQKNNNEKVLDIIMTDENSNAALLRKRQRIDTTDQTRKKMALSIFCSNWLLEEQLTTGPIKILSDYIVNALKRGAVHESVSAFEEYQNKIITAHELANYPLALALIDVAEDMRQAIECSIKAKALEDDNSMLSNIWRNVAETMHQFAESRERCIEAERTFQASGVVSHWVKITNMYQSINEYLKVYLDVSLLSVNDTSRNEIYEKIRLHRSRLQDASHVLEKIDNVREENSEMNDLLFKAINYYQESANCFFQSLKLLLKGDINNYKHFDEQASSTWKMANSLEKNTFFQYRQR